MLCAGVKGQQAKPQCLLSFPCAESQSLEKQRGDRNCRSNKRAFGEQGMMFIFFTKINKCIMQVDDWPQLVHPERRQHPKCLLQAGAYGPETPQDPLVVLGGLLLRQLLQLAGTGMWWCHTGASLHFCCTSFRRGDKRGAWWLMVELKALFFRTLED